MNPAAPEKGENLQAFGALVVVLGFLIGLLVVFFPDLFFPKYGSGSFLLPIIAIGQIPFTAIGGAYLYFRGRQQLAKAATKEIDNDVGDDTTPDVLYLRPFSSDPSAIKHALPAYAVLKGFGYFTTEEEQLTQVLQPFGNVEAIGQPGERLPPPGAPRRYVPDEKWKDTVKNKMLSARVVIIRAGTGEGLWWELETAVKDVNRPTALLILVNRMKRRHYKSFAQRMNLILPVRLPEFKDVGRWPEVSGFFSFSEDWKPRFLPLKAPWYTKSPFGQLRPQFQYALKPLFHQFDLHWEQPAASPLRILSFIWALLLLLASLAMFLARL